MTSRISHTTLDCIGAYALSEWWKVVIGYTDVPGDPNLPGHEECMLVDPQSGHRVLFIEVPDPTPGKNRMHFDLRPTDGTQAAEVDRLLAHGATLHDDLRGQYGPGTGWVTLADPEGNLFCVLRSDREIAEVTAG
ncbi:glyoxalase [Janibacter sp. Soil728]|uniref:VOC family protein n=1 Tax=Janibacter sp. Soil728 TaxID=1736393 RepID=UPI0006F6D6A2|nr:VOC family protein [Janibacter sp. Soil728]KRE38094.1 glyoxalase [Janibacter sp. Soil728]